MTARRQAFRRSRLSRIAAGALLALALPASGGAPAAQAPREALAALAASGISLENDRETWDAAEISALAQVLARLPKAYRSLGRRITLSKDAPRRIGDKGHESGRIKGLRDGSFRILLRTADPTELRKIAPDKVGELLLLALQKNFVHELSHAVDHVNGFSTSDAWLRISGWKSAFRKLVFMPPRNVDDRAYGREYGKTDPKEDFATYAEEFFFPVRYNDPEKSLQCRTRSKYAFFRNAFPDSIDHGNACQPLEEWIDPEKVEGLEILAASPKGNSPMSFAGHLFLRVKIRREEGESFSVENPNDPVLGFGADMGGATGLSMAAKGLSGKFPTWLEQTKLGFKTLEYTEVENRDVWRYRLKVSREQVRAILERLFEDRKNYRANYRFLTANCASLLLEEIAAALESDELAEFPQSVPFIGPHMVLARLAQRGWIEEVSPSFYSIGRRAAIAEDKKREIHAVVAGHPFTTIPAWEQLQSDRASERIAAYEALAKAAFQAPAVRARIQQILLLSVEEERRREFVPDKGVEEPGEAHLALRRQILALRRAPGSDPALTAKITREIEVHRLHQEEELKHRIIGSAYTGVIPIAVSPAYTVVNWEGTPELQIDTALYRQKFGDASRFDQTSSELEVLPGKFVIDLDEKRLSEWSRALFRLRRFTPQATADSEEVKSILRGGGVGFGIKVLELSGSRWKGNLVKADWLSPELLLSIVSSEGFRNYLVLSIGLDLSNVWRREDSGATDRHSFYVGMPIALEGQLELDDKRRTFLQAGALFTPRIGFDGKDSELEARITLSRILGSWLSSEFRLKASVEYLDDGIWRSLFGVEARR